MSKKNILKGIVVIGAVAGVAAYAVYKLTKKQDDEETDHSHGYGRRWKG